MLADAAEHCRQRQKSEEDAAHLRRLPRDAQGEGPRHRADRHAGPLARAADDRRGWKRGPMSMCRSRSAATCSKARRCWPRRASTSAWCRSARNASSTPHLIEAQEEHRRGGPARQDRPGRDLLLLPHAGQRQPARRAPCPTISIMKCGPAPRRCGRTTTCRTSAWWRTFMEYGNGIMGDMCIHMLDTARWMLDLGWPKRDHLGRRHLRRKGGQIEHHRHPDRHLRIRRF